MFEEFKPALFFLVKFFAFFLVISLLYQLYLNRFNKEGKERSDSITKEVTVESTKLLTLFGYDASCEQIGNRENMSLQVGDKEILKVIEPCNGVNIIILFSAFVFAYGGKLKRMIAFILAGTLIIHLFNIVRIALLAVARVNFSSDVYHFLYKYVFTGVIYLFIVFLWVLWVNKYSKKEFFANKNEEQKLP